jgi:hypothetical protein
VSHVTAEDALTKLRAEAEQKLDAIQKERAAMEALEAKGVRLPAPLLQAIVDYLVTRPYAEVAVLVDAVKAAVAPK